MKRWVLRALMAGLILAVGFWAWTVIFPSPERAIRKRLADLAQSVSIRGNESPVAKVANASRVAGFFTADVDIRVQVLGAPARMIKGREELFEQTKWMRLMLSELEVQFLDVNLAIGVDKKTAEAHLVLRAKIAGEPNHLVQELKLLLNKTEGSWKIQSLETVKTLSQTQNAINMF